MAAERRPTWLVLDRLDPPRRRAALAHLRGHRPVGMVGQGVRNERFYRDLTVRSVAAFTDDDVEPWGILETVEHGAVVVPYEIALAADLPRAPVALRRLAARVGPMNQRLARAQAARDASPAVVRLRERFIAAAIAHATLHRQLELWGQSEG
ncbi:hypothetical protein ABIQ69_01165 [Agromyces sp. G08B096]|uniref:Uncharacterized protein n=1 Tax=Agromyces sp. G08B096 TaxID=3156399 RepID=A0AAU7W9G6_9MICO